jgi:hypothetical protein
MTPRLVASTLSLAATAAHAACGAGGATQLDREGYTIGWRASPRPLKTGRPFAIDFVVCPKGGAAQPDSVIVDATMPEHGHGMNYRASVTPKGPGRWRAEGLLLHMSGSWELSFDLRHGERSTRLAQRIVAP